MDSGRLKKITGHWVFQYLMLVLLAVFYSLSYVIFIFPNDFAPAGINGLSTMVQYLFHFNVGYMSILINFPMLVVAFFTLNRQYALRTLVFISVFSTSLVVMENLDLSAILFVGEDVGSRMLGAIAGGIFGGWSYSVAIRLGGSTGGTDVIGAFLNRARPEFDTVWIIFVLNIVVAVCAFFVYGMDYVPVILCVLYCFFNSRTSDAILKGLRSAAKYEVVTTHPDELAAELMAKLRHGCTMIHAEGMFSHTQRAMLICVVNKRQVVDFERIVRKYDSTFAYVSSVNGTVGNFRRVR